VIPDAVTMASARSRALEENRADIDSWSKKMNKSRTMH
jgi:hypothetical protein